MKIRDHPRGLRTTVEPTPALLDSLRQYYGSPTPIKRGWPRSACRTKQFGRPPLLHAAPSRRSKKPYARRQYLGRRPNNDGKLYPPAGVPGHVRRTAAKWSRHQEAGRRR